MMCRSAISNVAVVKRLMARGRLDKEQKESFPVEFWQKVCCFIDEDILITNAKMHEKEQILR